MLNKNESQFTELQLVEIDHNKFAVQLSNSNVSVNLTKMGKPFGESKKPKEWLRTNEAKEYLKVLGEGLKCPSADLLIVRKGGTPDEQGTWVTDYRLAMRYAQWLSPTFSIKVDELLVNMLLKKSQNISVDDFAMATLMPTITINNNQYHNYKQLLEKIGMSTTPSAMRRRIRKFPQEFYNDTVNATWFVTVFMASLLQRGAKQREDYKTIHQRTLTYTQQNQLALFNL